jgi:hypothetical protein
MYQDRQKQIAANIAAQFTNADELKKSYEEDELQKGGVGSGRHQSGDTVYVHHNGEVRKATYVGEHHDDPDTHVRVKFGKQAGGTAVPKDKVYHKDSVSFDQNGRAQVRKSFEDELEKGGEGSRGGKVIGHTSSGKPIYAHKDAHEYKDFTASEHQEAANLHNKEANYTKGKSPVEKVNHQQRAREHQGLVKEKFQANIKTMNSEERKAKRKEISQRVDKLDAHRDNDEDHFFSVVSKYHTPKDDGESEYMMMQKLANHKHYDKIIAELGQKKD